MRVIKNNNLIEMTYEEICKDLGFVPNMRFVEVTRRGNIGFTCGKPEEVRELINAVKSKGYGQSDRLKKMEGII